MNTTFKKILECIGFPIIKPPAVIKNAIKPSYIVILKLLLGFFSWNITDENIQNALEIFKCEYEIKKFLTNYSNALHNLLVITKEIIGVMSL